MSDDTILKFIDVAHSLAYLVVFVVSAVVVFFALQQTKLKNWFAEVGVLAQIIAFIILTKLLAQSVSIILSNLFSFPRALVQSHHELIAGMECFNGLIILTVLVAGSWLLWKRTTATSSPVELEKKTSETDVH